MPGFGKGLDVVPTIELIKDIPKYDAHVLNKKEYFKSFPRELTLEGTIVEKKALIKLGNAFRGLIRDFFSQNHT